MGAIEGDPAQGMDEARFGHFGERDADEGAREKCGMRDGRSRPPKR